MYDTDIDVSAVNGHSQHFQLMQFLQCSLRRQSFLIPLYIVHIFPLERERGRTETETETDNRLNLVTSHYMLIIDDIHRSGSKSMAPIDDEPRQYSIE